MTKPNPSQSIAPLWGTEQNLVTAAMWF